jgi:hypothetical protein
MPEKTIFKGDILIIIGSALVFFLIFGAHSCLGEVGALNCPELPYLPGEYEQQHVDSIEKKCNVQGPYGAYIDDGCFEISQIAVDDFRDCLDLCEPPDLGLYNDSICTVCRPEGPNDCSCYECVTGVVNKCAVRCRDYLEFEFVTDVGGNGDYRYEDVPNEDSDSTVGYNASGNHYQDRTDVVEGYLACAGKTPENSEICPKDDMYVLNYTEKKLVESCSSPVGSEPKCEYVCVQNYFFGHGKCVKQGMINRIIDLWVQLMHAYRSIGAFGV